MNSETAAELRKKHYNATVVGLRKVHSDLMMIRVRPDFPLPPHQPGQYTSLGLGCWEPRMPGCQDEVLKPGEETKLGRRAYSIAHPVLDDDGRDLIDPAKMDYLEFYIVLVRDSEREQPPLLTPRLFLLRTGDRIFLQPKITGHYTLDTVKAGDTVLFFSTGTGEAPHNYMLWDLLRRHHEGLILAACCVRYRRDLGYLPLYEELARRYRNFHYLPLTTRESDTVNRKVYVQDLIASGQLEEVLGERLDPARAHAYLCGNPKMIGVPVKDPATGALTYPKPLGVVEVLEQRGFKADQAAVKFKGNVHFEEYW
jgi:ferredoxin--NADP+ reductase